MSAALGTLPATPAARIRRRRRPGGASLLFYAALTLGALIWISPILLLLNTALKSAGEFAQTETFMPPQAVEWGNFARAWAAGVET